LLSQAQRKATKNPTSVQLAYLEGTAHRGVAAWGRVCGEDVSALCFGAVRVLCAARANAAVQARRGKLLPAAPAAAFGCATTPRALQENTYEQGYFKFRGVPSVEHPQEWKDPKSAHEVLIANFLLQSNLGKNNKKTSKSQCNALKAFTLPVAL